MQKQIIRLGIADDHKSVRQAYIHVLSKIASISIVLEADNGNDLINKIPACNPEVILLDLKMPKGDGLEALKFIHENYPEIRILVISAYIDEVYVGECLRYGIYGYLTKEMDISEIVNAIFKAHSNEMFVTNLMGNQLLRRYLHSFNRKVANILPEFTIEEIRILKLLSQERTTQEISSILNLSKRSIELKKDKMREKAGVKTIGGLLLYGSKRGFIE